MVEMNKVLELDPNYYQAYYEKGFCFQKMKRYEEAIIEISKAIEQITMHITIKVFVNDI